MNGDYCSYSTINNTKIPKHLRFVTSSVIYRDFFITSSYNTLLKRNFIFPASPESKKIIHDLEQGLSSFIVPKLHSNIFGFPKGKSLQRAITKIIEMREKDSFVITFDLKNAFQSVDCLRLKQILKNRFKISDIIIQQLEALGCISDIYIDNLSFRGLPQGYATSPILFCAYLTPLLQRLQRQYGYQCLFYADDGFGFAGSLDEAQKFIFALESCFAKHSHFSSRLKLSKKKHKLPKTYSPKEILPALGLNIGSTVNDLILPRNNFASFYRNTLTQIQTVSIKEKLPPTLIQFLSLSLPDTTSITTDDTDSQQDLTRKGIRSRLKIYKNQLDHNEISSTQWDQCFSGWALPHSLYDAPYVFSRSFLQQKHLGFIQTHLYFNSYDKIDRIYQHLLRYDNKNSLSYIATFRLLVDELWTIFIYFHPFDTLTGYYYKQKSKILSADEKSHATILYKNELRIINRLTLIRDFLNKKYLTIPIPLIQKILRGNAHLTYLHINKVNTLPVTLNNVFGLGEIVWDYFMVKNKSHELMSANIGIFNEYKIDNEIETIKRFFQNDDDNDDDIVHSCN